MKVFTLKNCDTCKKALKWLDNEGISYSNHDVRDDGLNAAEIEHIVRTLDTESAVNRRSTTWRGLSDSEKDGLDVEKAVRLILDNPTLMKRPVFMTEQEVVAGFSESVREWLKS